MVDVLERIVTDHTMGCEESILHKKIEDKQQDLLPLEKNSLQSKLPGGYDLSLIKKYPIFHMKEVLNMFHKPWFGPPTPKFAAYNVTNRHGLEIKYVINNEEVETNVDIVSDDYIKIYKSYCVARLINIFAVLTSILIIASGTTLYLTDESYYWMIAIVPVCAILALIVEAIIMSNFKFRIILSSKFLGIIPNNMRDKIKDLQKGNEFRSIFLLQEVPSWNVKKEITRIPLDPLIIGLRDGVYYYVDKFDVTPKEDYIAREFTAGNSIELSV